MKSTGAHEKEVVELVVCNMICDLEKYVVVKNDRRAFADPNFKKGIAKPDKTTRTPFEKRWRTRIIAVGHGSDSDGLLIMLEHLGLDLELEAT